MENSGTPAFRIGILGATGYIGSPYRREIRESGQADIIALCARRPEPLTRAAAEAGAQLATDDWRRIVEHPKVNLVIIATPDALHHEAALACAHAGKHLICEKPLGVNALEARSICAAYSARRRLAHFVPFWTRYVGVFARAREMVRRGDLGAIQAVFYRWHNPRPTAMPWTWRDDPNLSAAGSIADVGSHAYDTVRWILDEEATRVLAHSSILTPAKAELGAVNLAEALNWGQTHQPNKTPRKKGGTPDYACAAWEFESGAVGSLLVSHATFLRKGLAPELELHGVEASLGIDRLSGKLTLAKPDGSCAAIQHIPNKGFGNRFQKYVFPALRRSLSENSKTSATEHPNLEDGWRAQIFTDAIVHAAQTGCWAALKDIPGNAPPKRAEEEVDKSAQCN